MKTEPANWERLKAFVRVKAWWMAYQIVFFVNRKWTSATNAPQNYTPNYEVIVTGLNANQSRFYEILATKNRLIPEPNPYPLVSIPSSNITITPAPMSCPTISNIVTMLIYPGGPQEPYQIAPAA